MHIGLDDWKIIAGGVFAAYLALITWLGRRHIHRLDRVELNQNQNMVTRREIEQLIRDVRDELRTETREQRRAMQELHFDIKLILIHQRGGASDTHIDASVIRRRIIGDATEDDRASSEID